MCLCSESSLSPGLSARDCCLKPRIDGKRLFHRIRSLREGTLPESRVRSRAQSKVLQGIASKVFDCCTYLFWRESPQLTALIRGDSSLVCCLCYLRFGAGFSTQLTFPQFIPGGSRSQQRTQVHLRSCKHISLGIWPSRGPSQNDDRAVPKHGRDCDPMSHRVSRQEDSQASGPSLAYTERRSACPFEWAAV